MWYNGQQYTRATLDSSTPITNLKKKKKNTADPATYLCFQGLTALWVMEIRSVGEKKDIFHLFSWQEIRCRSYSKYKKRKRLQNKKKKEKKVNVIVSVRAVFGLTEQADGSDGPSGFIPLLKPIELFRPWKGPPTRLSLMTWEIWNIVKAGTPICVLDCVIFVVVVGRKCTAFPLAGWL